MRSLSAAVAALSLFAAAPAPASDVQSAQFQVGGVSFSLPLPAGYCLPTGRMADAVKAVTAADPVNTTDLALVRCGAELINGANDTTAIKTPSSVLQISVTREELLTQLGAEFAKPVDTKSWTDMAGKAMSDAVGTKVDISGNFAPRGKDDVCAYMAGLLHYEAPGVSYDQPIAVCMTVVGGRILSIYRAGVKTDQEGILSLMREARAIALTIKPVGSR